MGRSSSPPPGVSMPLLEDLYDLHQVIGQGAYGVVWLAVDRRNGRRVAVKKITNVFEDVKEAKRTLREVRLMRHFRDTSPYILNMHDLLPGSSDVEPEAFRDLYVVTEYEDGGDLSRLCDRSAPGWAPPSEERLRAIAFGLLSGLRVLHAAHVLHRDLRPKNLLMSGDTVKIADFGMGRGKGQRDAKLAKRTDEKQTPTANRRQQQQNQLKLSLLEFVSNRYYTAPEGLLPNNEYGYRVDCWAVGCVLVELLLGYNPFKDSRFPDQMRTVINLVGTPTEDDIASIASGRNERFRAYIRTIQAHEPNRLRSLLAPLSPHGRDLVEGLLRFNPSKRLTAAEALAHPWLRDAACPVEEAQDGAGEGRKEAPFDGLGIEAVESESELRALLWREIEVYHKLHDHVHHQDPPSSSSC